MYFTKAIIINKSDRGENDKLLTVYTENYGKVNVLARGVAKTGSKLASQIDLLNFIEIGFAQGKAFKVLTAAVVENDFHSLKKDLEKFRSAVHFSNLVNKFSLFEESDKAVFDLLYKAFLHLEKNEFSEAQKKLFLRYFELNFLSFLGYRPPDKELPESFLKKTGKITKKELDDLERLFLSYFENVI